MIQLREKNLSDEDFIREAVQVKALCSRYNVPLIINDRPAVALKSGADGVHVGIEDQPVEEIRRAAGKDFIIGATAKTVEQAQKAQSAGADYLGVGAVFPSPTKKNAIRITAGQLREICASVSIPAVAIGGISKQNMPELMGTGIHGVAVVSAVFSAGDIKAACKELRRWRRPSSFPNSYIRGNFPGRAPRGFQRQIGGHHLLSLYKNSARRRTT